MKKITAKKTDRQPTKQIKMVDPELLGPYLAEYGLSDEGTLEERGERLEAYFKEHVPVGKAKHDYLVECTDCGFTSTRDQAACPFCGAADDPAPKGKAKAELATVDDTPPEVIEASQNVEPGGTVEDLDRAIEIVKDATVRGLESFWDQGNALFQIHSRKLYLQRRNEDDAPAYRSWPAFLSAEVGISASQAGRAMSAAVNCPDRALALELGKTKLELISRVRDETKLPELMTRAKQVSAAALEEELRPILRQKNVSTRTGKATAASVAKKKAKTTAAPKAAPVAKEVPGQVTAVATFGKVTVELFAKGQKPGTKNAKRAKRLADEPHGQEMMVNGVIVLYSIRETSSGLKLVVDRKRPS